MSEQKTALLEKTLDVPLTALEFILITFMAHRDDLDARDWVRALLTGAVRNELHADLKKSLLARLDGEDE